MFNLRYFFRAYWYYPTLTYPNVPPRCPKLPLARQSRPRPISSHATPSDMAFNGNNNANNTYQMSQVRLLSALSHLFTVIVSRSLVMLISISDLHLYLHLQCSNAHNQHSPLVGGQKENLSLTGSWWATSSSSSLPSKFK